MLYILVYTFINIICYCKISNVKDTNINDSIKINELTNKPKRRLATEFEPIRITLDTTCLEQKYSTNQTLTIINNSLNKAKRTLERLIKVRHLSGPIKISSYNLGNSLDDFKTYSSRNVYNDEFINTDLVIYVKIMETEEFDRFRPNNDYKSNDLYVKPNIIHSIEGRPVVGTLYYNDRFNLPSDEEQKKEFLNFIFLHGFTHILGFTKQILNKPNILERKDIKSRLNGANENKLVVISPKVLDISKKYFNCSTITYIELNTELYEGDYEDIHWDARILLGDYMISETYFSEQVISEFTLALLDSLDFYEVNYYTGGLMNFGKNKGCEFIMNDCIKIEGQTKVISSFHNEFCSYYEEEYVESFGACSSGRQSMGYCFNFVKSSQIPDSKRIMQKNTPYGFGKKFVEYCPLAFEVDNYGIDGKTRNLYYNGNCKIGDGNYGTDLTFDNSIIYKNYANIFDEKYSESSFCALSSILKKSESNNQVKGIIRPSCYQMHCSNKSLTVQINDELIVCPRSGGLIQISEKYSNYNGSLFCPDYNLICSGTELCNNMFDCVEKNSSIKSSAYDYSDYTNTIIYISPKTNIENEIQDDIIEGFELSEDGKCPINCCLCNTKKQCIKCKTSFEHYVGNRENDDNEIICRDSAPDGGYYKTDSYRPNKHYYFKCIENCKKCDVNKDKCEYCFPTHYLDNNECNEERIPFCKDYDPDSAEPDFTRNNGYDGYTECLNCNNSAGYYCVSLNKRKCVYLPDYSNKTYYNMETKEYPCVEKCEIKYPNCKFCDSSVCKECKEGFNITKNKKCVQIIKDCEEQNWDSDIKDCLKCKKNYYCINGDIGSCNPIDDIRYYYNITNPNGCIKRCSDTFPNCEECDNNIICKKCKEGYFFYDKNKTCIKNITGCINNSYDGIIQECNQCNEKNDYYCLNGTKTVCHKMETTVVPYYYLMPDINYRCFKICDSLVKNCLICNETLCSECTKRYIINNNGTYCFVKPFEVPDDDKCFVKYIPYNKSIYEIDPWDYADYYWENIPYISTVDHYIGENYTITVFTNSECTENLLNEGYYKIDSKELQNKMIKEAGIEGMKIIFSVFINYNHKNIFRYYDLETKYLNPNKYCQSCLEIEYNITNKFYNLLKEALGLVVANLITSEKIEFVDRDSDIYNDICKNITFFGIDLPLKQRLKYLYLHNYTEQILCNSENCTLEEYDYENITTKCKCKIGNEFKDILKGENFQFIPYEGQPTELNNDFIDSLEIIKCALNGFKSKNIKANIGFFISIIAIASQIVLFIYYCLFSKSIVNINNNIKVNISNPPKSKKNNGIMIISDWERITRDNNKIYDENEVYVQSRDDAEDQLLEEEKSYSKDGDIFDASSLSIDTNVGGAIRNISTGNKKNIKEKADNKRVLILLSNKGKNKSKNLQEDLISDSDIIPLEDNTKVEIKNFFKIYWYVLSLKQHIINYFSNINCCKITESYIPISIRLIRSIFMIILTFVLNILWLNQTYYENKFEYFNNEYIFIYTQVENKVPTGKRFSYAFSNTFVKGLISFAILLLVQFLIGFIFFSVRNNVIKAKKKNNDDEIEDVVSCTLKKYLLFFIINMTLMIIFLFSLTGFCGAYGGGFVDYFVASIISLIFLEIFPFLWSIVIALFIYFGYKKNNKWLKKISHFFMF